MPDYKFSLYIAGQMPDSEKQIKLLRDFLERNTKGQYKLKVINILNNLSQAEKEGVFATPTLVKNTPLPKETMSGSYDSIRKALEVILKKEGSMNKRILVVDDDEAIRNSFNLALEDTGYDVDTAETGKKALKMAEKTAYDLVYLDIKMPEMNGIETLRNLRKKGVRVPVYFVTAFHKEFMDELEAIKYEGIKFELLQKPIGNEQIVNITKSILEQPETY